MKLNARLNLIALWIEEKNYKYIWDVGSDHGLLPFFLSQRPQIKEIWTSDKSIHCIKKLKNKLKDKKNVKIFLADGLEKRVKYMDVVVLSGLGTKTIRKILIKDQKNIQNYLFQTNTNPSLIRNWCNEFSFSILKENIMKNKKHYYHTILITKKTRKKNYQKSEIFFGPILLKEKGFIFQEYWNNFLKKQKEIINKIKNIKIIKDKIRKNDWIKSFLN